MISSRFIKPPGFYHCESKTHARGRVPLTPHFHRIDPLDLAA